MSNSKASSETTSDHLDGLESGAGCTEIWERLSEQRSQTGSTE
jgi:hypothetical protein